MIDTFESRRKIGFPTQQEEWCEAPAVYDEHTLRIAGHPVMEDWEKGYMEKLAAIASSGGGTVLEVGYGMGLSALAIQSHNINKHIVVECHPDVSKKCIDDFKPAFDIGRMHLFTGFWQDVTPNLASGSLDGILFDTYPLTDEEIHSNHFWFFDEAFRLLKPGGILTYYSDEVNHFKANHFEKLQQAGFKAGDIGSEICSVTPPADCEYWQHDTILAPVVRKAPASRFRVIGNRRRETVKRSY